MDIVKYNKALRKCIQDCLNCMTKIARTESREDISDFCTECVQMCEITLKALAQKSRFIGRYMELCADICDWCAMQCEKLPYGECQTCAMSCRDCALTLRKEIKGRSNKKEMQVPYGDSNLGTLWY